MTPLPNLFHVLPRVDQIVIVQVPKQARHTKSTRGRYLMALIPDKLS